MEGKSFPNQSNGSNLIKTTLRSRTHILEDESLLELKKIFPKEWVFREKPKDYGIDVEIEIFDTNGNYTGIVFWIQLKATDSTRIKDHKSIRFEVSKINQLSSYKLPVILFRYNSVNKTFYFDLINRYAYLASNSSKKTYEVQFDDYHLWSEDSHKHLISLCKKKQRFESSSFTFPIKGYVNNMINSDKISRILSSKISKEITLINLIRDRQSADIEINILDNRIVLNLSGSFGSSMSYEEKDDILIFLVFKLNLLVILNQTDKDIDFFKFINDNELLDNIIKSPELTQYLLPKLVASETGQHFTREIVDYLFKNGDPILNAFLQTILLVFSKNIISQERIELFYNQIFELNLEYNNSILLATSYYNLGGYYRSISCYDKALTYYKKAKKIDSSYLMRGYFCRELGGILFELQFYKISAEYYRKAIVLEPNNIFLLATLGDAEFYSGNYEVSLSLFDSFLTQNMDSNNHDKYEFSLKFTLTKALVDFLSLKSQVRSPKKSFNLLMSYSKEHLQDLHKLFEVINLDALNPIAWKYCSLIYFREQENNMIFLSSLMQAILVKTDAKMWAYMSILTTYEKEFTILLNDIANTAYYYCREDFILELQEMIELESFKEFKGESFIKYVEQLIKTPKKSPTEIRFWNGENAEIIELVT